MTKQKLGRYEIGEKLGSGGFGVVYRGTSTKDQSEWAVKILDCASDDEALRRFKREVRIQSQLKHPNVIRIHDFDLDASPPWFAMPLAKTTLREQLENHHERATALAVFYQILAGVQHAHRSQVIHRDLKPENVLFLPDGSVAIADFGLGRLLTRDSTTITKTQQPIGTLAYMAPEQFIRASKAGVRSDIYALGKILYEMLTGEFPWPTVDLAKLPGDLQYIVDRCIRIDPAERFKSIRQLVSELDLLEKAEEFEEPSDKSKRILEEVLSLKPNQSKDIRRLDELLGRERGNQEFYRLVLPRIPEPLLKAYASEFPKRFTEVVEQYDAFVSCRLDFDYTDLVADLYRLCFLFSEDVRFRALLLSRLMDMGFSHNRFHVRDVFWELVSSAEDRGLLLAIAEVLRSNPEAAQWMAERAGRYGLPAILTKVLGEIGGQESDR